MTSITKKKNLFRKFSKVYASTSSHYFICLHHLKLMIRRSSINEYKIFADNFTEHFRERELNFFICWSSLSPWIMIFLRASIIVLLPTYLPTFKISYELLLHVSISFLNFIRKFILSFISIQCHTLSLYVCCWGFLNFKIFFLTIHFLNRTVRSYVND